MMAVTTAATATATATATANPTAAARTCASQDEDDNPQGRFEDANESAHYFHHFDADSCHGCINQSFLGNCSESVPPSDTIPPPWVHVFSKSCRPSSQRTQAASIAYLDSNEDCIS
jgi:hypothetical protein